ncbi:MAG TPA: ATP-dependent DNA helicase, partial [Salinisphaeraceae bacterium]|nr:ATP-dependent DNA helicase [Salinisphaeraceae bacterium]
PLFEQCWVMAARRKAQQADLVIINHYLLFADLTLREQGFGELLPDADVIILDEAHQLPDIAGRFFGQAISGRQLQDYVRDAHTELGELGGDMPELARTFTALANAEKGFAQALAREPRRSSRAWLDLADDTSLQAQARLATLLQQAQVQLEPVAERSEGMASLLRRAGELCERLAAVNQDERDNVSWIEPRGNIGWVWHSTPLDIAEPFARAISAYPGAWIFTSATLAVDNSLAYFCARLGLGEVECHILPSPFDYANNARLYVPARMPATNAPDYTNAVAEQAIALIRAAGGGAFVLCTSYRALHACAQALTAAGMAPLVQGQGARAALLSAFRQQQDQVLVGTSSFWQGVDVRGHGLRLVIIDKLPFAAPSDPVLAARSRAIKQAGGDPFMDHTLPQTVISLKQGVGRLIRDSRDRGLLAICDTRLYNRRYAVKIRNSLPPMPVTRDLDEALTFLQQLEPLA